MTAEVRKPLLERVDVVNFRLITAENCNDVVEDLGIKVLEKERVEISQLIERVELVDDRLVISPDLHIELFDMLDVQVFPELVAGLGQIVFGFKDIAEVRGERAIEEHVPDHIPCIGSADGHLCDSIMRSGFDTPFFCEALSVLCGVICFPHMAFEGVFLKIVIRRADIGVVENLANQHERGVVVTGCILAIYNDFHPIFVLEVEE